MSNHSCVQTTSTDDWTRVDIAYNPPLKLNGIYTYKHDPDTKAYLKSIYMDNSLRALELCDFKDGSTQIVQTLQDWIYEPSQSHHEVNSKHNRIKSPICVSTCAKDCSLETDVYTIEGSSTNSSDEDHDTKSSDEDHETISNQEYLSKSILDSISDISLTQ